MRRQSRLFLVNYAALAACLCAPLFAQEAVVTTELGTFRFEFAPDKAPEHVEQFIARARQGYYDGGAFNRVIADGIIQGREPAPKNPNNPLPSEFSGSKHDRGTVSTDGAQFFICVVPQPALDGHYSALGRVTEGMDVVERISRVPADKDGIVNKPVRILGITIEPTKVEPFLNAPVSELGKTVTLKTTLGTLKIRMEPDWAPENVRAFLRLTATGWYDGTPFHRIAKGFVVQGGTGGSPDSRWIHPVKDEFRSDVQHTRGIISMAHGDDPDSATTSFFLVLGPAPHLDGKYSAFGRVVEGMEVLDAFEKEDTDGETPRRRLEIIQATIDN